MPLGMTKKKEKKERNKNQQQKLYSKDVYFNLAEIAISKQFGLLSLETQQTTFSPILIYCRVCYVGHFITNRGVWKYVVHF